MGGSKMDADIKKLEQAAEQFIKDMLRIGELIIPVIEGYLKLQGKNTRLKVLNKFANQKIEKLSQEITDLKKSVILDSSNANRNGRPPIGETTIQLILQLRKEEKLSYRKISKEVGVSATTVFNYISKQQAEK